MYQTKLDKHDNDNTIRLSKIETPVLLDRDKWTIQLKKHR